MGIPTDSTPVADPKPVEGSILAQLMQTVGTPAQYEAYVAKMQRRRLRLRRFEEGTRRGDEGLPRAVPGKVPALPGAPGRSGSRSCDDGARARPRARAAGARTRRAQRHRTCAMDAERNHGRRSSIRADLTHVKLPVFEGPLDLLLYLIKKDELDIYDIPIEQITSQLPRVSAADQDARPRGGGRISRRRRHAGLHQEPRASCRTTSARPRTRPRRTIRAGNWCASSSSTRSTRTPPSSFQQCLARQENVHAAAAAFKPEARRGRQPAFRQGRAFRSARRFPESARARQPGRGPARHFRGPLHGQRQDPVHPGADRRERSRIVFEELFVAGASRTEIVVTFLAVLELIRLRQIDVAQEGPFAPIELVRADCPRSQARSVAEEAGVTNYDGYGLRS